jgi:hypothetical protein
MTGLLAGDCHPEEYLFKLALTNNPVYVRSLEILGIYNWTQRSKGSYTSTLC